MAIRSASNTQETTLIAIVLANFEEAVDLVVVVHVLLSRRPRWVAWAASILVREMAEVAKLTRLATAASTEQAAMMISNQNADMMISSHKIVAPANTWCPLLPRVARQYARRCPGWG